LFECRPTDSSSPAVPHVAQPLTSCEIPFARSAVHSFANVNCSRLAIKTRRHRLPSRRAADRNDCCHKSCRETRSPSANVHFGKHPDPATKTSAIPRDSRRLVRSRQREKPRQPLPNRQHSTSSRAFWGTGQCLKVQAVENEFGMNFAYFVRFASITSSFVGRSPVRSDLPSTDSM
jgi:hypothetical protein